MVTHPAPLPPLPALVRGTVYHRRRHPITHRVRFGTYLWLVDVDELPDGPLARFPAHDHLGGVDLTLREAVTGFAAREGARNGPDDRIVMLAGARVLGHAFNPLSVFWCLDPAGRLRWAVLEVHNTYGQRHAYLVEPDKRGRCAVRKAFYVSPFLTIEGDYRVRLTMSGDQVGVAIALVQHGAPVFTASFHGRPRPATRTSVLRAVARTPLVMHQTTLRIRLHGIRLWLRGVPLVSRARKPTRAMP